MPFKEKQKVPPPGNVYCINHRDQEMWNLYSLKISRSNKIYNYLWFCPQCGYSENYLNQEVINMFFDKLNEEVREQEMNDRAGNIVL